MGKISMSQYGELAAEVLAKPRRVRVMLEEALRKKRLAEDAAKNGTAAPDAPASGYTRHDVEEPL